MAELELLILLGWHLALTALPGAAACLFAAHLGVRQVPVLLAIALAVSALAGLLGFWFFFADPLVGETYAYLVIGGSALLLGFLLWERKVEGRLLRSLATPALLWALGSAFLLFLGFIHGGSDAPLSTSATRFSHAMPGDNLIPIFYADWFFENGHRGTPPTAFGWHFSDRPPLQVGFALLQRPFGWDAAGRHYQVMGVVLQQLWIVGLWALLLAGGVGRATRALTMAAVLLSGLALVNGFFVWPKMLPTALLLAAAALTITPLWKQLRSSLWAAALIAALVGLAFLSHGSAVFGAIALAAVAAWRGLPGRRWLGVAAAVVIVLVASWSAYQRYDDPPGNRLTKWTLAGVIEEDDERGTMEAILDSYGEAGVRGAIDHKVDNFEEMVGIGATRTAFRVAAEDGSLDFYVRTVRDVSFFYLLPSLWLLLLGPPLIAAGWKRRGERPREWRFALTCFAAFGVGVVAWGLISFGNLAARTVIHVGSYLIPLLAVCGIVAGMRAVFPRLALAIVGLNALLGLVIYAPALNPPPDSAYSPLAAILCAAALAAFGTVAIRGGRRRTQEK